MTIKFPNVHVNFIPKRLDHDVTIGAKGYAQGFPIRREGGEFNRALLPRVRLGIRCCLPVPLRFDIFAQALFSRFYIPFPVFGHFRQPLIVIIIVLSPILVIPKDVSLSWLVSHVCTEGARLQE